MTINEKTIEKLRELINEQTEYRSGPKLVEFFSDLGIKDSYGQGFPSRWIYTESKIKQLNGTPELDKCIRKLFNPIHFIGRISELDQHINELNQYLAFDKWQVSRDNTEISFKKASQVILNDDKITIKEDEFLEREFKDVNLELIGLDNSIVEILELRLSEIKGCFSSNSYLSVIFLAGSSLEGILLGVAMKNPKSFNQAKSAPKNKEEKVKSLHDWTLSQLIDTSYELNYLKEDVKKFSHALRDFRNYIHPYQQLSTSFYPTQHTAKNCFQVLKAAIYQLSNK